MEHPPHTPPVRTRIRTISVGLLGLEALSLAILAVYSLLTLHSGPADSLAVPLAVFFALFALALLWAARSLNNRGRFGVSFGITWQLFQALVGASALRGGLLLVGFFALILAIVLFILLLRRENKPDREFLLFDTPTDS